MPSVNTCHERLKAWLLGQALPQVVADAQGIGHDGKGRVHGPARGKDTAVHHIQVIELPGTARRIERGRSGVASEPDSAVLMGDPGEWDPLAEEEIACEASLEALMSVFRAVLPLHEVLQLRDEPGVPLLVVGFVLQGDASLATERDPIVGIGQVLGCQLEVERMFGHQIQAPAGSESGGSRAKRGQVQLPDKRNVAHRVGPVRRTEIEVV